MFRMNENIRLFDDQGNRLYLTDEERTAFLAASKKTPRQVRTFCAVLHFTGCRLSEALELTPRRIDLVDGTVRFETLKKRRKGVYRAVPVPPEILDVLDMVHGISEAHKRSDSNDLDKFLWPWSRTTAWRRVSEVMNSAMIQDGPHKCPKGLRHGYGVAALAAGVPLNMLQKWMGHSRMETTAIYANAIGQEQQKIAARMWG
jgi:integrase/recombinase XerD